MGCLSRRQGDASIVDDGKPAVIVGETRKMDGIDLLFQTTMI